MNKPEIHPVDLNGMHIPNNLWLAPLAGYSHKPFRQFAARFGAAYSVTEMVSLEGLVRLDKKTWKYLDIENEESTAIQLFGKCEPVKFYQASKLLQSRYAVKVLDVNFGCPVRKVIRGGAGSAHLRNPQGMADIVKSLKDSGVLVSAKIRLGFDKINIEETVPALHNAGADIIIVHGRLATQFYNGKADWEAIARARQLTDRVFIANGDIKTPEDAKKILEVTGADGIMIGRQAVGSPYLFTQILDYFKTGSYRQYTLEEIKAIMLDFSRFYCESEKRNSMIPIRGGLIQYVRNYQNSREVRNKLSVIKTLEELEHVLQAW